jgi:putative acetyltransferase
MFRLVLCSEFELIREIYRESVRQLAPLLYTQEQVIAWSSFPDNLEKFWQFVYQPQTYVMEFEKQIIGFCGLRNDGHIASFYFHPNFTRKGFGTKMLNHVLDRGINQGLKKFYTEASFFSQPVFSRCGFVIVEMETVKYGEVSFERYKMEKRIIE